MAPFRESIRRIAEGLETCEEWLETLRDLDAPIPIQEPAVELSRRWATKEDLFAVNVLEGFSNDLYAMEKDLEKGDRCLLLEREERICAFAWVTFRDYSLALWYTLKLSPHSSYLVYIFVHPEGHRRGVATYLLGLLMKHLREQGCRWLFSGMFSNWDASIRLHEKMGFAVHRHLSQCKLFNIFPLPLKEEPSEA